MTVMSKMPAPGRKVARSLLSSTEKSGRSIDTIYGSMGRSVGAWVKEDDESEMRGAVEVTG